jgi:hypothetical protein
MPLAVNICRKGKNASHNFQANQSSQFPIVTASSTDEMLRIFKEDVKETIIILIMVFGSRTIILRKCIVKSLLLRSLIS